MQQSLIAHKKGNYIGPQKGQNSRRQLGDLDRCRPLDGFTYIMPAAQSQRARSVRTGRRRRTTTRNALGPRIRISTLQILVRSASASIASSSQRRPRRIYVRSCMTKVVVVLIYVMGVPQTAVVVALANITAVCLHCSTWSIGIDSTTAEMS
jgi:hypothetical protein